MEQVSIGYLRKSLLVRTYNRLRYFKGAEWGSVLKEIGCFGGEM